MKKELPIYRVEFTGSEKAPKWAVLRPDDSKANDCDYDTKKIADSWLKRYVALKYCREA